MYSLADLFKRLRRLRGQQSRRPHAGKTLRLKDEIGIRHDPLNGVEVKYH